MTNIKRGGAIWTIEIIIWQKKIVKKKSIHLQWKTKKNKNTCIFWGPRGFEGLIGIFYKLSIEVAFFNTLTNLLAMVYADKKFRNTEFSSNSLVKSRLNLEIRGLAVTKKFLLNQDFDCSKWSSSPNIGTTSSNGTNEFILAYRWLLLNKNVYLKKFMNFH